MWLIIIFILGTLCVIFNEKIGEFLSGIIDFDLFFSRKKKKRSNSEVHPKSWTQPLRCIFL